MILSCEKNGGGVGSGTGEPAEPERLRIEVSEGACTGTRLCNVIAPEVLRYDEDAGATRALTSPVDASDEVLEAAEKCPVGAILLWDGATGEPVEP